MLCRAWTCPGPQHGLGEVGAHEGAANGGVVRVEQDDAEGALQVALERRPSTRRLAAAHRRVRRTGAARPWPVGALGREGQRVQRARRLLRAGVPGVPVLGTRGGVVAGPGAEAGREGGVTGYAEVEADALKKAVQFGMSGGQVGFVCPSIRTPRVGRQHAQAGRRNQANAVIQQTTFDRAKCYGVTALPRAAWAVWGPMTRLAVPPMASSSRSVNRSWAAPLPGSGLVYLEECGKITRGRKSTRFRSAPCTCVPWGARAHVW